VRMFQAIFISLAMSISLMLCAHAEYACDNADQAKARPNGVAQCQCVGTDNCSEMKNSDSCKSSVNCGAVGGTLTTCNCDAKAKIAGSSTKAIKPAGKSQK
jgi:hypothetical protein